jgi:hypothetical protein
VTQYLLDLAYVFCFGIGILTVILAVCFMGLALHNWWHDQ